MMAKRYQPHFGMLVAGCAAWYGLLVISALVLFESRGPLRSPDFFLAACVAFLLFSSDLLTRAVSALKRRPALVLFFLLIAHFLFGALRVGPRAADILLQSYLPEILRWSLLGFIAASGVRARVSSGVPLGANPARRTGLVLSVMTLALVLLVSYFGIQLLRPERLLLEVLTDQPLYQVFADYYCVLLVIVIGVQTAWFESSERSSRAFVLFGALVVMEGAVSFLVLQVVGSNKGPALLLLVCLTTILSVRPVASGKIQRKRQRRARITALSILAALLAVAAAGVAQLDLRGLRLFEGGEGGSAATSSVAGRVEILAAYGMKYLGDSPVFGNPALGIVEGDYLHSIVSIQSNLGIIGTVLVSGILILGWRRLRRLPEATVLRISLVPILVTAAVSSFYVWGPLWFLLSGLASLPVADSRRYAVDATTTPPSTPRLS